MRLPLVVLAAALSASAVASPALAEPSGGEQRYVVQFRAGTSAEEGSREVRGRGGRVERALEHVFSGAIARMSPQAAAALRRNPRVADVELDAPVFGLDTQPSPPWGLDRVDQVSLPLSASYSFTANGTGVTAYVVDTGIRADHVDLAGRVDAGYTVIGDGVGAGDCNGHGTHVAGTIGGSSYGVAKAVRLVPVRVLDCNGSGTVSGIVTALDWVVGQHVAGAPAVANLSLGGAASGALDTAVQSAVDDGISVAVAAGNSNVDACTVSPARAPAALTVGATDSRDARASFSNYGSCLDLFAPGVAVLSAWYSSSTDFRTISGTSMATPHVAGAAAALLEADPTLSPAAVAERLTATATTGVVTGAGAGSPDRLLWSDPALLAAPPPATGVPSAPTSVSATAGDGAAQVSWTAADPNGSPIAGYTVTSDPGGSTCTTTGETTCTVTGLVNGTSHTFTVFATNGVGDGPSSAPSPPVVPAAPDTTAPSVTITDGPSSHTSATAASLSFTGTDPDRPAAALAFRCSLDGAPYAPCTSPTPYTGLGDGLHTFSLEAADEAGNRSAAATRGWQVDTVAPSVSANAQPVFTTRSTVGLSYAGQDVGGSGIRDYDVRYRSAPYDGDFGAFSYPDDATRDWTSITTTSVTLPAAGGTTYCLSARSRDIAGNMSPWSPERCTAVALDDRSLSASSGWSRGTGSSYYASTITTTKTTGAKLTRTNVQATRIALVATRCAGCGTVGVYLDGTLLKQISLDAATTAHRQIIPVAGFSGVRTGTVTVKTLNGSPVRIDGLALNRR
jgi:hypothetical protein